MQIKLIALMLLSVACLASVFAVPQTLTADENKSVSTDDLFPKSHSLKGLPVYTANGDFNPALAIQLIVGTVSSQDWEAFGGTSSIQPYPGNDALMITTTAGNHEKIEKLFDAVRPNSVSK